MSLALNILIIAVAVVLSGIFATLTYSLRDYSRAKLESALTARGREQWLDPTLLHSPELAFLTASIRLLCNMVVLLGLLFLVRGRMPEWLEYVVSASGAAVLTIIASVTIPHALAAAAGETFIAIFVAPLHGLRGLFRPLTKLLQVTEHVVRRATAARDGHERETPGEELQSEILAAVEEGEKTGVVNESEREMIESIIEFRDTSVAQVMTTRPDMIALAVEAPLEKASGLMEESGHSRIPLYEGSIDHVVGVLYARDLLKYVGESAAHFVMREVMRPPFFVPDSKPLRDLLQDFRLQKVHIAIVLDEYGGTAGLVTIEDVLEELVGEISDEHEPIEPAVFHRLDEMTAEVDAKLHVDELNRLLGTNLPEDGAYETLSGFISTHLGSIPKAGVEFEYNGVKFAILEAEPQRISRVKVQMLPIVAEN
ncbi:MAG: HlyC/CorC family transporter [Burkholderiales bacterium]|nr:HlyC/CorC family transporter [Phycisphaerae bacterium]